MEAQLSTPVVFIIFNRPDITWRVFSAIREVRPKKLLVIADGPRSDKPGEAEKCAATRAIIDKGVDWDCEVSTNFSDINLGIRNRFATGFKWVFENVNEAIILEHDCLPHVTFFSYCEELLNYYRDNPRVMWIGGTNPVKQKYGDGSYFFSRCNWIWGWATWKRAWQHYDINVTRLPQFKASKLIDKITPYKRMQDGFMWVFEFARHNSFQSWDAQSTFTIWSHDGLTLIPNVNLISNIGFGENATNTKSLDDPLANLKVEPFGAMIHPTEMRVYPEHDVYLYDTYCGYLAQGARNASARHRIASARHRIKEVILQKIPFRRPLRTLYRFLKSKA